MFCGKLFKVTDAWNKFYQTTWEKSLYRKIFRNICNKMYIFSHVGFAMNTFLVWCVLLPLCASARSTDFNHSVRRKTWLKQICTIKVIHFFGTVTELHWLPNELTNVPYLSSGTSSKCFSNKTNWKFLLKI